MTLTQEEANRLFEYRDGALQKNPVTATGVPWSQA
tara:strand:+ start:602 stop:706 length:105 start_codon:yes stop_codon:yes gene_type:complete